MMKGINIKHWMKSHSTTSQFNSSKGKWKDLTKNRDYSLKTSQWNYQRQQWQQNRYFHESKQEKTKDESFNSQKWKKYGLIASLGLSATAFASLFSTVLAKEEKEDEESEEEREKNELKRLREAVQKSNQEGSSNPPIYRIVLTGGPCGGKSTSLSLLADRLRSLGFRVFVVPEAATIVVTGGGIWKDYKEMTPDQALAFEGNLMKTKMALEDAFFSIAQASGEPSVIICDRGTMDTAAYLPRESWEVLLDTYGWNLMNLRDRRYDAVLHLVTSAIGAEKYYTTENNTARTETMEEARALDFKILNAWVGHPTIRIIDNSSDFHGKVQKVITHVCQVVGAPKPVNYKRKFVIETPENIKFPVVTEQFEVEQTYLLKAKDSDAHGYTYIRRRGQNGSYHYSHSTLRDSPHDKGDESERTVLERHISGREYIALLKVRNYQSQIIVLINWDRSKQIRTVLQ
eukprot:TRINITY_DN1494_c0_g1_i2.p1 TRINITY_DN1494_c0_g1~~TRINITY_DN1494_c0_g1_i2.p1  ORF type:complete len:459 (-),score=95.58 TRINITY_DN1494_c0_g1_i2:442-1818(-)